MEALLDDLGFLSNDWFCHADTEKYLNALTKYASLCAGREYAAELRRPSQATSPSTELQTANGSITVPSSSAGHARCMRSRSALR
jgi:hypothetical protein